MQAAEAPTAINRPSVSLSAVLKRSRTADSDTLPAALCCAGWTTDRTARSQAAAGVVYVMQILVGTPG